jgi:hypothetical protein
VVHKFSGIHAIRKFKGGFTNLSDCGHLLNNGSQDYRGDCGLWCFLAMVLEIATKIEVTEIVEKDLENSPVGPR